VGIGIIRNSADTLKTTVEWKSANIVFADADLESAIANAFFGIFYNKGDLLSRVTIAEHQHDAVVDDDSSTM